MPRVSEDHLLARREQILTAARTCFLAKGLHNTSMQDLIQEAGLSVGAVYRYFKSKNEIINAIADTVVGGITQHIDEVAERRLPMVDSLDAILIAIETQIIGGGNLPIALQMWGEATLDPTIGEIVKERYSGLRNSVRTLVAHAVEDGELPAGTDVDAVTTAFFSLIPGYALQRLLTGVPDRATYLAGVRALIGRA
ncbi:TetR/AcrR family transcriptional regulator [Paractinoplanes rishiriensis]|uniref:TetR family transcriptional regulator n=1 Tax=Paractinoplanes rishiriensis TaxID=1050105 RepID=A0A919MXP4_9ACTN|nr:TetR/AcrR family transcriptional regulator [Actinoplanes rishiriensis]GIE99158.1 TetR family transcriptional regulator [Actinoplanes rishiriensis]